MRILALVAALLIAAPVHAVVGTCSITKLDVVGSFLFPIPAGAGSSVGTDVTGGTFAIDRTPFDQQFPSPGVSYFTVAVTSYLMLDTGVATGTIDANGNVVIPDFTMTFGTEFGTEPGDPPNQFPLVVQMNSGLQAPVLSGRPLLLEGSPVDPTTGAMRILGANILNFQLTNLTGPGIGCTLSPVPDLSSAPAAPLLKVVKGKGVTGPDAAANDDELTLTAKLQHGATPPSLDGSQDVILRLRKADGKFITALLVQKGRFTVKGKKATAKDAGDGATIEMITPFDLLDQAPVPATGGTLTMKRGKKVSTLVWKVQGLGLDELMGPVNVAIAVGTQTAYADVTVTAGKKGPKFK